MRDAALDRRLAQAQGRPATSHRRRPVSSTTSACRAWCTRRWCAAPTPTRASLRDRRRAALRCPGVLAVLTVRDAPELGASVPPLIREPGWPRLRASRAGRSERVRHVGEAVAVVVADDALPRRRRRGSRRRRLRAAAGGRRARRPCARAGPRRLARQRGGASARARCRRRRARLRRGRAVVEVRLDLPPRHRRADRGARGAGRARCRERAAHGVVVDAGAVQRARGDRAMRSACPRTSVRVIAPDVGGGFGIKGHVYPEDVLVPARRPAARPAGEVGGDAARALPHRLRRSRSGAHRAARRAARRDDHGDRDDVHARPRRVSHAGRRHDRQHHQPPGRSLPGAQLSRARRQHRHAQELRRRLPRRRPAGGRARPRSPARPCRARHRHGSRRSAPPQPRPARAMPFATGLTYRDGVPIIYDAADYVGRLRRAARAPGLRRAGARSRPRDAAVARPIGIGLSRLRRGHRHRAVRGRRRQRRSERPRARRRRRGRPGPGSRDDAGPDLRGRARRAARARRRARRRHRSRGLRHGHDRQPRGRGGAGRPSRARPARWRARARLVAAEMFECAPEDVVVADGHVWVAGAPDRRIAARAGRPRRRPQPAAGERPARPGSARASSSIRTA